MGVRAVSDFEVSFKGLDDLGEHISKAVDLNDVKAIVKGDTAYMQGLAQRGTPVDTGNLRRSEILSIEDDGLTGKVTAGADYSPYQEYGTRWIYGKHFMKKASQQAGARFLKDLERLVK